MAKDHEVEGKIHDCFTQIMEHIHPGLVFPLVSFLTQKSVRCSLWSSSSLWIPEMVKMSQKWSHEDTEENDGRKIRRKEMDYKCRKKTDHK